MMSIKLFPDEGTNRNGYSDTVAWIQRKLENTRWKTAVPPAVLDMVLELKYLPPSSSLAMLTVTK